MYRLFSLSLFSVLTLTSFQAYASFSDSDDLVAPMDVQMPISFPLLALQDNGEWAAVVPMDVETQAPSPSFAVEAEEALPHYLEDSSLTAKQKRSITGKINRMKKKTETKKAAKALAMQKAYHRKNVKPGFRPEDVNATNNAAAKDRIARMSPEERAVHNAKQAAYQKDRIARMSPEELAVHNAKQAAAKKAYKERKKLKRKEGALSETPTDSAETSDSDRPSEAPAAKRHKGLGD